MIDAHRGAFEYDWRTRFHLPLTSVGKSMPWGEAYRLATILLRDPASQAFASVAGWDAPRTRDWFAAADLYDLTHQIAAGKKTVKPYPRPRTPKPRLVSQARINEALRNQGHGALLDALHG